MPASGTHSTHQEQLHLQLIPRRRLPSHQLNRPVLHPVQLWNLGVKDSKTMRK